MSKATKILARSDPLPQEYLNEGPTKDEVVKDSNQCPRNKVIHVKEFLDFIDNKSIYTRKVLEDATKQLERARRGDDIELNNVYGHTYKAKTTAHTNQGKFPKLGFNNIHILADLDPYRFPLKGGAPRGDLLPFSKLPVRIDFADPETVEYDWDAVLGQLHKARCHWEMSNECQALEYCLRCMKHAVQVTNIVCLGHGTLTRSIDSIMQHIVTSWIASELEDIYNEAGRPLEQPIVIYAQDPAYTAEDADLLTRLDPPIQILPDAQGFMAINSSSLVMSFFPCAPVRHITADLFSGEQVKGPAAVFWEKTRYGFGVDLVTYPQNQASYCADPVSRAMLDMLKGFEKVIDGAEVFGNYFEEDPESPRAETERTHNEEQRDNAERLAEDLIMLSVADTEDAEGVESHVDNDDVSEAKDSCDCSICSGFGWLGAMDLWARRISA